MVASFLTHYGYAAIAAGTFLEGETILIAAGFSAYRGHLHLEEVILAAFLGTLAGDQLSFYLGRRPSHYILSRRSPADPTDERRCGDERFPPLQ